MDKLLINNAYGHLDKKVKFRIFAFQTKKAKTRGTPRFSFLNKEGLLRVRTVI